MDTAMAPPRPRSTRSDPISASPGAGRPSQRRSGALRRTSATDPSGQIPAHRDRLRTARTRLLRSALRTSLPPQAVDTVTSSSIPTTNPNGWVQFKRPPWGQCKRPRRCASHLRGVDAGDMDAVRERYDPDVLMRTPEDWPEQGPFVGREAVMREWEQLRETWLVDVPAPATSERRSDRRAGQAPR